MADSMVLHSVMAVFAGWYDAKMIIERAGAISTDAMHVIAGVLLQLLFAIIFHRPLSSWLPWLAVFALLAFNEAVDFWAELWPSLALQIGECVKDLLLTMLLPTALLVAFRLSPAFKPAHRR